MRPAVFLVFALAAVTSVEATHGANGGAVIRTSAQCTQAIKERCIKLSKKEMAICQQGLKDYRDKEKCVTEKAGGVEVIERCQADHIDELIDAGCTHLRCKRVAFEKCGCPLVPNYKHDLDCWQRCWKVNQVEFKQLFCTRPPAADHHSVTHSSSAAALKKPKN